MNRHTSVPRPRRRSEYLIFFDSKQAQRGWDALRATRSGDLVNAWEHLTQHPKLVTSLAYPLKGELSLVTRGGVAYPRWQLKLSKTHGARIWYYVNKQQVLLEQVHTGHPRETR